MVNNGFNLTVVGSVSRIFGSIGTEATVNFVELSLSVMDDNQYSSELRCVAEGCIAKDLYDLVKKGSVVEIDLSLAIFDLVGVQADVASFSIISNGKTESERIMDDKVISFTRC